MSPHRAVEPPQRPLRARVLLVLWPAFVMAGVLEMLVFAVVDPGAVQWPGADTLEWSRSTMYSVTFLVFWAVIAVSTAVTEYLTRSDVQ
ncbi:MAG TPA: hypothetical protein VFU71_15055 [Burkholderiaceae bacterium]|nr:hypothetical protein [Burkholderiaceae bacterium]